MTEKLIPASREEDDDLFAAEYVLGVLDLPDRAQAEARLRQDSGFLAKVTAWEMRLEGLNAEFAESAAADLMPAIEARLFPRAEPHRSWFAGWRGVAIGAVTSFVVAALVFLTPSAASFTATLSAEASGLRYEATVLGDTITVAQISGETVAVGKTRELWLIVGDNAPLSLGLLTGQSVSLPLLVAAGEGAVLAISLEPEGGSPTGAPTGPVLVSGALIAS